MNQTIKAGDMVQLVRPCPHCGCEIGLGRVFAVGWVGFAGGQMNCCYHEVDRVLAVVEASDPYAGWQASRLRKLPPISELEDVKHEEEITA